jgi:hypothetical protein
MKTQRTTTQQSSPESNLPLVSFLSKILRLFTHIIGADAWDYLMWQRGVYGHQKCMGWYHDNRGALIGHYPYDWAE